MAPPLTLTFSGSMPSAFVDAMPTAANASLSSNRSMSSSFWPDFARAALMAFAGCSCS